MADKQNGSSNGNRTPASGKRFLGVSNSIPTISGVGYESSKWSNKKDDVYKGLITPGQATKPAAGGIQPTTSADFADAQVADKFRQRGLADSVEGVPSEDELIRRNQSLSDYKLDQAQEKLDQGDVSGAKREIDKVKNIYQPNRESTGRDTTKPSKKSSGFYEKGGQGDKRPFGIPGLPTNREVGARTAEFLRNKIGGAVGRAVAQATIALLPWIAGILIALIIFVGIFLIVTLAVCQELNKPSNLFSSAATTVAGAISPELRQLKQACSELGLSNSACGEGVTGNVEYGSPNGIVTSAECGALKQYEPYIKEASNMYGIPEPIIGAIMSRETRVGTIIGGCTGYGDNGYGHGLGQIDPTSGAFGSQFTTGGGQNQPIGKATIFKDKNGKNLVWSDCRDGVVFIGYFLDKLGQTYDQSLTSQGVQKGSNEYYRQIFNSYNSGKICKIGTDDCTTGRDYGSDVLKRSSDINACLQKQANNDFQDDVLTNPTPSKIGTVFDDITVSVTASAAENNFINGTQTQPANSNRIAGQPNSVRGGVLGHNDKGDTLNKSDGYNIYSPISGTVITVENSYPSNISGLGTADFGNYVGVKMNSGPFTGKTYWLGHIDKQTQPLKSGDQISVGQRIGSAEFGSGSGTGAHYSDMIAQGTATTIADSLSIIEDSAKLAGVTIKGDGQAATATFGDGTSSTGSNNIFGSSATENCADGGGLTPGDGKCILTSNGLNAQQRRQKLIDYKKAGKWTQQTPAEDSNWLGTASPAADQNLVDMLLAMIESGVYFETGSDSFYHGSHTTGFAVDLVKVGKPGGDNFMAYEGDIYKNTPEVERELANGLKTALATGVVISSQVFAPNAFVDKYSKLANKLGGHENHLHIKVVPTSEKKVDCGNKIDVPAENQPKTAFKLSQLYV